MPIFSTYQGCTYSLLELIKNVFCRFLQIIEVTHGGTWREIPLALDVSTQ